LISDEARALHDDCLVVDLHCDTLLSQRLYGYDPTKRHKNRLPYSPLTYQADIPRMLEGGIGAVALGIVVNPLRRRSGPNAIRRALRDMASWEARAPESVAVIDVADDIVAARAAGKVAIFGGLEGAHGLDSRVEDLAEFRAAGLRYVGLSHFTRNAAATNAFGWGANNDDGLTDFGRDLIDALNQQRILVDLAHINRPGFMEICERTTSPLLVSHTGVRGAYDVWRNIDDEQLKSVADTGGVIGIIFAPAYLKAGFTCSLREVVMHIKHVINVAGEDHTGLGTDVDGFVTLPPDFPDVSAMPLLTQYMLEEGMTEQQIRKCLGGNTLRAFREVCG
jgi:membrane dipeptidase